MAEYRLHANIISRGKGQSAVAAAAYRSGERLYDERYGKEQDYTRKSGVLHTEIVTPDRTPDWMKDRAKLWNAVEAVERRKDAQLSREIQLSLPHELDLTQNRDMVLGFIQSHFVDHGMIADIAIHAPNHKGDDRNIHAHVMLTTRTLTVDGFGNKNREWNKKDQLKEWRAAWAEHENAVFRELGMDQRVDHRSYADQGIDREPTQHLGTVANDMERKGKASRVGDENRARQQRNAERAALAQQSADVSRKLAAEKARQQEAINIRQAGIESQAIHDNIDMDQRFDSQRGFLDADIEKRNGEHRRQWEAERQQLEEQLKAEGWRKLMRDVLGKTKRDQAQLEANRKNLENMRMREDAERQALQAKQEAERQAYNQRQQQRAADYALKLEQDRMAELQRLAEERKPQQQPQPANDRIQPSWQRSAAPEQDNRTQGRDDFQKAAVGAPAPSPPPATDDKKKAIEAHKAKIRDSLRRDRGKDGIEYD